jgi:hypothetical protein
MESRVHPKYKTKCRVNNWAEYDRSLVQRGDITLWISKEAHRILEARTDRAAWRAEKILGPRD